MNNIYVMFHVKLKEGVYETEIGQEITKSYIIGHLMAI